MSGPSTGRRWAGPALAACLLAAPAAALDLFFVSPPPGRPAWGRVTIELEVTGEAPGAVTVRVDGVEAGVLSGPPWTMEVDLGDDFGGHRFEAVAETPAGAVRALRQTPPLRIDDSIDLGLQQLYVTVERRAGASRPLAAHDFEVRDAGRVERIVTFEGGDAALAVALLIDASDSMRGRPLAAALEGARSFVSGMRELDEAAVFLFSDELLARTPFSQRPEDMAPALAGVEARGGTALNDALYLAIRRLERRQGRRVVVLLSDGVDVHSALGIADVLWLMRRSRSMVYWIDPGGEIQGSLSMWRSTAEHAAERTGLGELVRESGGRVVPIDGPEAAPAAFGEILAELRRQVVLGYYPSRNLGAGSWHPVRVRVREPGARARTRGGYVEALR